MMKRTALAATIVVASAFASVIVAAPAQAAAYRYWSYWLGADGQWSFANVGAGSRVPADGTVEGWRFSVSGVAGNDRPSFAADFDTVCADTPAQDGHKRVAVIVDPGLAQDAPEGEQPPGAWALCVVAEPRATGYDVLRAAAPVRVDDGLICAIGGYPARECAVVIDAPEPTPSPTPSRTATPTTDTAPSKIPTPAPTATTVGAESSPSAPRPATVRPSTTRSTPSADQVTTSPSPTTPSPTTPSPTPSLSVLAGPVPPVDDGGGNALVAGAAVLGIGVLGGAAVVMMRRRSP